MYSKTGTMKSTDVYWGEGGESHSKESISLERRRFLGEKRLLEEKHFMGEKCTMGENRFQGEKIFKRIKGSLEKGKKLLDGFDAIVVGAGAGLSTSAGFTYSGKRFEDHFPDFIEKYGFRDMYSAGFYPYRTLEEYWAYWSRYIFINRYQPAPKSTYDDLWNLVRDKDYFVLTTNVDHCFQKSGFDKRRLFYVQGDYGLWQCSRPCHYKTYDNEAMVRQMVSEQENMRIPSQLVPRCPICGEPMSMNLRVDNTFVEDDGWHRAAGRYEDFIRRHRGRNLLFLELGVGSNTPGIIKFSFWHMVHEQQNAAYVCINIKEAYAPEEIRDRSICIYADMNEAFKQL